MENLENLFDTVSQQVQQDLLSKTVAATEKHLPDFLKDKTEIRADGGGVVVECPAWAQKIHDGYAKKDGSRRLPNPFFDRIVNDLQQGS